MQRYLYILLVLPFIWACNDQNGRGLEAGEQITVDLTNLIIECPDPDQGCMEVFKDRIKFLAHDGSETEPPARDPMFTCVDCNPDIIYRCAEPPPGGGLFGDGGALIEVTTKPRIKRSLSSEELQQCIAFAYTQDDLNYRDAHRDDNINHQFISFAALEGNYDQLLKNVYKDAVIKNDREIIPDNNIDFFMLSNAGRMNIAVVRTANPNYVIRMAYRDFDKLQLVKFVP